MQPERRESYAAGADRLSAWAAAATPEAIGRVADELLAIGDLLSREPRLRRALADPAHPDAGRVELLRGLLAGKVGDETLELAGALVAGRWPHPSDLLDAIERLAVEALLTVAERAGALADVEDELFRFGQVVGGTPALAVVLADQTAPVAARSRLVGELLDGKVRPVTRSLADVALTGFGGRTFAGALTRLVELTAARRDREVAYVTTATPLSEEDERRLGDQLTGMYGRPISLKITVDPKIIGGLSVQVGSDLYDGTVRRRLDRARAALAG
jgi:F-type H+-transporting ATPase subunit delta